MEQIERVCISPNSICNMNCRYCYFFGDDRSKIYDDKLSSSEIYTILDQIYKYSMKDLVSKKIKVNFVGSGEPLLSWTEIKSSLEKIYREEKNEKLRFYIVTNGLLLNKKIISEMKMLNLSPSISIDGNSKINDKYRRTKSNEGTFNDVIKKFKILKEEGFDIVINTTVTRFLMKNLGEYFEFLKKYEINKVIFDRLVDVPKGFPEVSYNEFYNFLEDVNIMQKKTELDYIEIGNLEAFRRGIQKEADKVCTMFGSCCGAGINNIIYLQREVYPCGRMFDDKYWKLGEFNESLHKLQNEMLKKLKETTNICKNCEIQEICINDCLLEQIKSDYSCFARKQFIIKMSKELR